jgi:hypothetical protein
MAVVVRGLAMLGPIGQSFEGTIVIECESGCVTLRVRDGAGTQDVAVFKLPPPKAYEIAESIKRFADQATASAARKQIVEGVLASVSPMESKGVRTVRMSG